jgi:plastocyanin
MTLEPGNGGGARTRSSPEAKQFKSKPLDTDDKFTFTFTTPGTYEYFCSLRPHMTGTIVVEAATGAGATP